ncbi:unnamed protein product [Closterium sp. NIES-53]
MKQEQHEVASTDNVTLCVKTWPARPSFDGDNEQQQKQALLAVIVHPYSRMGGSQFVTQGLAEYLCQPIDPPAGYVSHRHFFPSPLLPLVPTHTPHPPHPVSVVTFDLRGAGKSTGHASFTGEPEVADVMAVCRWAGEKYGQRVVLVGSSAGERVVLLWSSADVPRTHSYLPSSSPLPPPASRPHYPPFPFPPSSHPPPPSPTRRRPHCWLGAAHTAPRWTYTRSSVSPGPHTHPYFSPILSPFSPSLRPPLHPPSSPVQERPMQAQPCRTAHRYIAIRFPWPSHPPLFLSHPLPPSLPPPPLIPTLHNCRNTHCGLSPAALPTGGPVHGRRFPLTPHTHPLSHPLPPPHTPFPHAGAPIAGSALPHCPQVDLYVGVGYTFGFFSSLVFGSHYANVLTWPGPKLFIMGAKDGFTSTKTLETKAGKAVGVAKVSIVEDVGHFGLEGPAYDEEVAKRVAEFVAEQASAGAGGAGGDGGEEGIKESDS